MSKALLVALAATLQLNPAPRPGWKTYRSSKGGYSAALPIGAVERKQTWKRSDGPLELNLLSSRRGVTAFSVAVGDVKADDPSQTLDAARDELVKQSKGTLLDEKDATTDGQAGRELRIEIPRNVVAGGAVERARILIVGERLYELVAVQSASDAKFDHGAVDSFFASFRLKDRPTPAPAVASRPTTKPAAALPRPTAALRPTLPPRPNTMPPATTARPRTVPPGWTEFQSASGGFSIAFPEKPRDYSQRVNGAVGQIELRGAMFTKDVGGKMLLAVYTEFPGGTFNDNTIEAEFDNLRDGTLQNFKGGKVAEERTLRLGKTRGREVVIEIPAEGPSAAATFHLRSFIEPPRLFQLSYFAPKAQLDPAEMKSFFDSFAISKPTAPSPPLANRGPGAGAPAFGPAGWKKFASDSLGFQAEFPGEPEVKDQKVPTPAGEMLIHSASITTQDGVYLVTVTEAKARAIRIRSLLRADGMVRDGKALDQREITVDGRPGRDFTFKSTDPRLRGALTRCRVFSTPTRSYAALYIQFRDDQTNGNAGRFVNSFKITQK